MMDRQAAPRHIGRLGRACPRLDEVAMVKLDLEGHVLEIVRSEIEGRLRKIDTVIMTNLGAGQRPHLTRIAAGDIEKGEGPGEGPVQSVVKDPATSLWESSSLSTSFW